MTSEPAFSLHREQLRDTYPDLAGKVAAVTGGSRGIGAATAGALAANGAVAAAAVGRDHAAIEGAVQGISAEGSTTLGAVADCTVESGLATLHRKVADDLGPIDILPAFAGGNGMPVPTDAETGVIAFTRHLAGEFAKDGIRVNCVAPSAIENDHMRSWVSAARRRELAAAFPLGPLGQPEDVSAATLFLASSASSWITGVTLDIADGKIML